MVGVVLAGGLGTRLLPLTRAVNKHLLPVGAKPMLFYPLERLAEAGIKRVVIVVGGKSTGDILQTVKDGHELGLESVAYAYQEGEGGIAAALGCARGWTGGDDVCVVLGDNIFDFSLKPILDRWTGSHAQGHVVLTEVDDPSSYGVPEFENWNDPNGYGWSRIKFIHEKPQHDVTSNYAVIGVYLYRADIFGELDCLKPSARGELEISDLNNLIARGGKLGHSVVPKGSWFDAGSSLDALVLGTKWVLERKSNVVVEDI